MNTPPAAANHEALHTQLAHEAKEKFEELRRAGQDKLETLQLGVELAFDELRKAVDLAMKH